MIILYIVLAGIAIPFILAIFVKDQFTIERSININQPKDVVFSYIKLLKNQDHYSKWVMTDPAMKKVFTGVDGTVGSTYAWDSENKHVGKGEQEIMAISDNRIDAEIRFERPFKGVATTALEGISLSPTETKVTWTFVGNKNYVMKVMHMVLNLAKVLGKDIQESLVMLKANLENIDQRQ